MSQFDQDFDDSKRRSEPKQRGCFFYGCLFSGIALLVVLAVVGIGLYMLYSTASKIVNEYTETSPVVLVQPDFSDEQRDSLKQRSEEFRTAIDTGRADTFSLTGDELTALLQEDPNLKDRVVFSIDDNKLKGQVSLPFDFPGMGKRYLNGSATFKVFFHDGVLMVTVDEAEAKGQPVPEEFLQGLRGQNLAREATKNEKFRDMLRRVESLEIKDGKIVIKAKGEAPKTGGEDSNEKPEENDG